MKHSFFLLATVTAFITTLANAQTNQLPSAVEKGRLMTTDGQKITFVHLTTGSDSHSYNTPSDNKLQNIPADHVIRIEQQTGTEAGKWALWLGLSGLVGSALGVLSATTEADTYGVETDNSKILPIVFGITAASALIGVAIGSGKKKYKTIYTNPKYESTSMRAPLRIGLTCSPAQGIGIGLNFKF